MQTTRGMLVESLNFLVQTQQLPLQTVDLFLLSEDRVIQLVQQVFRVVDLGFDMFEPLFHNLSIIREQNENQGQACGCIFFPCRLNYRYLVPLHGLGVSPIDLSKKFAVI